MFLVGSFSLPLLSWEINMQSYPERKTPLFNPTNLTSFTRHYDRLAQILAIKLLLLHGINNSQTVLCRTNSGLISPVRRQLQRHRQMQ